MMSQIKPMAFKPATAASEGRPASDRVTHLRVDEASETQRIDNYLAKVLKGVPKSHIYRILRSGEIRVNKKRVDAEYRLQLGDEVRVPPIRVAETAAKPAAPVTHPYHCKSFFSSAPG